MGFPFLKSFEFFSCYFQSENIKYFFSIFLIYSFNYDIIFKIIIKFNIIINF
jgi:hypothetical protein